MPLSQAAILTSMAQPAASETDGRLQAAAVYASGTCGNYSLVASEHSAEEAWLSMTAIGARAVAMVAVRVESVELGQE